MAKSHARTSDCDSVCCLLFYQFTCIRHNQKILNELVVVNCRSHSNGKPKEFFGSSHDGEPKDAFKSSNLCRSTEL